MLWMANTTVRTRIAVAFGAMLLCTVLLGVFALKQIRTMDALATTVRSTTLPATRMLGTLAQTAERLRL